MEVCDELYEVMKKREPTFDGRLYVGIVSTGIVCYPSCRSRLPKRENVRVYASFEAALTAGFRSCKRCKPDSPERGTPDAEIVRRVRELISVRFAEPLTLPMLATELNMSPYHLQRTFKRFTSKSPTRQLQETRLERARVWLMEEEWSINEIAKRVGFRSVSHFSTVFHKEFGVTPMVFRSEGRRES